MAWNQNSSNVKTTVPRKPQGGKTSTRWLATAGTVAVGVVALWFAFGRGEREELPQVPAPEPPKKLKAVDVKFKTPTNKVAEARTTKPIRKPGLRVKPCGTNEFGFITNLSGYVIGKVGPAPAYTNRMDLFTQRPYHKIFKNAVHRKIAFLYDVEPGEFLFGDSERFVAKDFAERFDQALSIPITISPDDDDETRAFKQGVIDTMKDLKAIRDKGGDVRAAMVQAREELREVGLYRKQLESLCREAARDRNMSNEDLDDFVAAANQKLAERGAKPLTMPRTAMRRMMISNSKEAAKSAPNGAEK